MQLDHNCAILGSTRTGKTTSAIKLLLEQKGALKIFINTKREIKWYDQLAHPETAVIKYQCYNEHNMETIYNHFDNFTDGIIQIVPDATNKAAIEDLEKILNVILFRQQSEPHRTCVVCVDEIQVYQSAHSCNDTLARMWVMGLGIGIRMIAIAQSENFAEFQDFRPQMIHFNLLANTEYWIIHALPIFDLGYLRRDKGVINYDPENPPQFILEKHEHNGKNCIIPHNAYIQKNKQIGLVKLW